MITLARAVRCAALAGIIALAAAPAADAQRSQPRPGVGAPDPVPTAPTVPYPGANVTFDPRAYTLPRTGTSHRRAPAQPGTPPVVYVIPVPVGGYGDYGSYGYGYPPPRAGGVYDTNGRPMSSIGFEAGPAASAAPSYTPDLSGSPYLVVEGGAMLVDLASGERRSVPPCAVQDPDGRPRTVFFQGGSAGVVLRQGQRGRVQGSPAAGARACYAVDSWGRVVLQ
ncbi:MAG: hypothetical protein JWL60_513 [Gemmatimonadetes bacterium]|nr:hypothetical protein [Gemmatimonadota bacterium]